MYCQVFFVYTRIGRKFAEKLRRMFNAPETPETEIFFFSHSISRRRRFPLLYEIDSSTRIHNISLLYICIYILRCRKFSKAAWKTKEKLKKNGNFYAKSIFHKFEFGFWCNFKKNTWNFYLLFIFEFSIHNKIFKILWFVLNCYEHIFIFHFFFSFYSKNINKIVFVG